MTEPTLFPLAPIPVTLTERQAFVFAELRKHEDGLAADEVGALLCERNGRHDAGTRCDWCSSNGTGVLKALRKKGGLVRRKRGGLWLALERGEEGASAHDGVSGASPSSSAQEGPGDLPDGF
jgi:hypothetical protein